MKKSKFYLMSAVLGLVATTLIVSSLASAGEWGGKFQGKNFDPARHEAMQESHEAMQTALENGDYDAWRAIVDSRPRITDAINEDNFDQFVQMHNYMQESDFEATSEIRAELGLPERGMHKGFRMMHKFRHKNLEK